MKKRTRGNPIPLVVEDHPVDYDGYPFITLLQYRNQHLLTIVDNVTSKQIRAYVLDACASSNVNEEEIILIAAQWWENNRDSYPASFEFSKTGMTEKAGLLYRTFNIEYVTRVIGPLSRFDMSEVHSIKRRRRKSVPIGMEIKNKTAKLG